ncbi:MAG: hypothetical protein R3B89_33705 [Polyangiaceae bacterium]
MTHSLRFVSLLILGLGVVVSACSEEDSSDGSGSNGGSAGDAGSAGAAGTATAGGGSGGTAGAGASGGGGSAGAAAYPARLSETGLYADVTSESLADGVQAFEPQFKLWSDGATKRRWVYLPDGAQIDTSDHDYWVYPQGTKLWKEFTRDGVRVETRMLEKTAQGWTMIAYQWQADQQDALPVPDGVENASGTSHDIPSVSQCQQCHDNLPDRSLGFTEVQLAHSGGGVTLQGLIDSNRLTSPPSVSPLVPGDATARAALGYLHANCGMCHNPKSQTFFRVDMNLWLQTAALDSVQTTPAYLTTVGVPPLEGIPAGTTARIAPHDPEHSAVLGRMKSRELSVLMPPLGTEDVDESGSDAVEAWINAL